MHATIFLTISYLKILKFHKINPRALLSKKYNILDQIYYDNRNRKKVEKGLDVGDI